MAGTETTTPGGRLPRSIYLSYGVGSMGTGMFAALPGLLLMYFMTDTLGVAASLASLAVFIPKIWDVVTDPIVGALSDKTQTRWGRRRPYLLAGSLTLPVFLALLFAVPDFASPMPKFWWVMIAFILCATAYTLFQVPYVAMPAEMTQDYDERTAIMSFRMAFMTAGILIAGGAAPAVIAAAGGGRHGYAVMSVSLAAVCLIVMLIAVWGTAKAPFTTKVETTLPFKEQMAIAWGNKPFLILMIGFFPQQIAVGSILASLPYFVKYIIKGPDTMVTPMFLCFVAPAIVTMPWWVWVSRRLGKLNAYLITSALFAVMDLSLLTASAERMTLLYIQTAIMGSAYAGIQLFPFSMLPDAIQADYANSGLRREGIFTGVWTAGEKTGMAGGALLVGLVLGASGFVETVAGQTAVQPESALTGIIVAFSIAPAALLAISLPVLWRYDLNAERLAEITRRAESSRVD